jgi:hypothetical protein
VIMWLLPTVEPAKRWATARATSAETSCSLTTSRRVPLGASSVDTVSPSCTGF